MAAQHFREFERLLSLQQYKKRVLAWSVQAICFSKTITIKKPQSQQDDFTLLQQTAPTEGKIFVYRGRFVRLLNWPKPLRDQLILELPTLNAFRTTEVATVQHNHINLDCGDIQVLDSKKHVFFTMPLDPTITMHIERYLAETHITEGLLFRPGWKAGRRTEGPMTDIAIDYIWKKWCLACGIPYMSPRYGRAYFAVNWHVIQGKSLIGLMDILRHSSLLATQKYLSKIRCYEDVKAEFYQGMKTPFAVQCDRFEKCPIATPDCHCRMYTPKIEVDTKNV